MMKSVGGDDTLQIKLQLQWIWSKVEYLQSVVQKWDTEIGNQTQDLADFKKDLICLYLPFDELQRFLRAGLIYTE